MQDILSKAFLRDLLLILVGSFLLGVGYSLFLAPVKIVPGGVYGISIVINHLTTGLFDSFPHGLPIGAVALIFNIPLFVLALGNLGRLSAIKTAITFLFTALFSDLVASWSDGRPIVEGDPLLCAFYGGALLGFSVYLIFMAHSTCAGTDTLARVLSTKMNVKISTLIIVIDSIVVLMGLLAFGDWSVPLYSWIAIFVYGKVVEVLQPAHPYKSIFIISNKTDELRDLLCLQMGLRGTYLHGRGMYLGTEREVIFVVIERKMLQEVKLAVLAVDDAAIITAADASNDSRIRIS